MSETETVPESIVTQQIVKGVWVLMVNGKMLDERFGNAKDAVAFGKEKYGIEPKARMLPKKGASKKGGLKKNSVKSANPGEDDVPEEQKKNHVAKVNLVPTRKIHMDKGRRA